MDKEIINLYFAYYHQPFNVDLENEVEVDILEEYRSLANSYPPAKFDAEGKFSWN